MKVTFGDSIHKDFVYGDDFESFAVKFQEMEADWQVNIITIPSEIDFELPFMENIFALLVTDPIRKVSLARFQICYWATVDPNFTKPIALDGFNSLYELRMISGLGSQIQTLYIYEQDNYSEEDIKDICYAAGDR